MRNRYGEVSFGEMVVSAIVAGAMVWAFFMFIM
jgi:hypothetical protein